MPSYNPPKQVGEPQDAIDLFWQGFNSRKPGHVRKILPLDRNRTGYDPARIEGKIIADQKCGSYEVVREACIKRVQKVVRECKRHNRKFQDPDFDIYDDFRYTLSKDSDTLHGLPTPQAKVPDPGPVHPPPPPGLPFKSSKSGKGIPDLESSHQKGRVTSTDTTKHPRAVHRVSAIFESPLLTPKAPKSHLSVAESSQSRTCQLAKRGLRCITEPVWNRTLAFLERQAAIITVCERFYQKLPAAPKWSGRWLDRTTWLCRAAWSRLCRGWRTLLTIYLWFTTTSLILARFANLLGIGISIRWLLVNALLSGLLQLSRYLESQARRLHFSSAEIRQSDNLGNCWWLSAVATLSTRDELLRKNFVAWDQDCGVYGFCFYRDGSWMYTVIDDYLYLTSPDFVGSGDGPPDDKTGRRYQAWKNGFQRGSDALFFGKCQDSNQTWLPLLEKAYSKIHGDYDAVHGGCPSEAVEDLTGGVSSPLPPSSVLDKEKLWREMLGAGKDHVYSLNAPATGASSKMRGITLMHAFSVDRAFWYFDFHQLKWIRLLEIRNPWGVRDGLWEGAWGQCSKEWSLISTWFLRSNPQQDGVFFMTYEDAINTFDSFERTRLLDEQDWCIKSAWVKMNVPWTPQYNPVYFTVHLTQPSDVVLALSQLEDRYFLGLVGRYVYHLTILLRHKDAHDGEYIAYETAGDEVQSCARRSVTIEKHLPAGDYEVLVKINALTRGAENIWSVEDTLRLSITQRPKKLQQIARNYDQAFAKLKSFAPSGKLWNSPGSSTSSDTDDFDDDENDRGLELFDPVKSSIKMISKPEDAAWNAVCGVGLRVFSKDPDARVELHTRNASCDWRSCTSGSISGVLTPPTDATSEVGSDDDDEWHDVFEVLSPESLRGEGVVGREDCDGEQVLCRSGTDAEGEEDAEELALRKLGWILAS